MNTVQENCSITKAQFQAYMEENYEKLGFSIKEKEKILKYIKLRKCKKEMVNVLYKECLKKINGEKREKNSHLTQDERITIEMLFTSRFPNTVISMFVGVDRSTIGREIAKGKEETEDLSLTISYKKKNCYRTIVTYSASKANGTYKQNRSRSRKKYKLEKDTKALDIITKLLKGEKDEKTGVKIKYSPKAIDWLLKQKRIKGISGTISYTAIYKAAHKGIFGFNMTDLPHGRCYYKHKNAHAQFKGHSELKKKHSIENMPEKVKNKESITHFEGDSIIGRRLGTHNTLITLVNISSRFLLIERAKDKTAHSFIEVLDRLEAKIPGFKKIIETLLLDNGVEFSDIEGIMKSIDGGKRLEVYFAHPYTSCERGCNENKNKDVRKDFPKGEYVENLTDEDILNIARRINNTPREVLGWRTALEVFEEQLQTLGVDTKFLDEYRIGKSRYLVA